MSRFLIYIALFSCVFMAEKGHAQTSVYDELRQIMRLTVPKGKVTQVIDGQTLIINNAQTIHLPAIYIPVDKPYEVSKEMRDAKDFLQAEFLNKTISIFQVRDQKRGQVNALGHLEGYIVREDGLFAQESLVANGLAFVYPTQTHYDIADRLYKAEQKAREASLGLWANSEWKILTDQEAKQTTLNRFAIVEGVVEKVASRNNVIYLNFERDWRSDFTISIDSHLRREFSKYGHNLMQMGGQPVRVRGWIRDYNGPYMEIFHPSQLEILDSINVINNVSPEQPKEETIMEETIKERVLPNSAMFPNPTLEDVTLPDDLISESE